MIKERLLSKNIDEIIDILLQMLKSGITVIVS